MVDSGIAIDAPGPNRIGPVNPSAGHRFDPFGEAKFSLVERLELSTPTTASLASSSPSTPNSQRNRIHQAHIRTNFGKSQSYVPPQTPPHPSNSPTKPVQPMPPPEARRAAAWDDEDMPFDQMGLSRPVPHCTPPRVGPPTAVQRSNVDPKPPRPLLRPFDEPSAFYDAPEDEMIVIRTDESSPDRRYYTDHGAEPRKVQVLRAYCSDTDKFRSTSPSKNAQDRPSRTANARHPSSPLSGSEATTRFASNSNEYDPTDFIPDLAAEESLQNYEEFGLSPGSATDSSHKKPRDRLPRDDPQGTDDDSLFHFEEEERKRSKIANARKSRRFRRTRKVDDDASSLEADDSLPKRAQQAYQRRNRHLQKSRPTSPVVDKTETEEKNPVTALDPPFVSPDSKIADNDTGDVDAETVASATSANSDYTKSMESEVEDIFKDLFFIGSGAASKPGRRPFKFQTTAKRESRRNPRDEESLATETLGTLEEDSTVDASYTIGTVTTMNGENISSGETSSGSHVKKSKSTTVSGDANAEPDPLTIVWEFLEGGASMMGEALGISSPVPTSVCAPIPNKQHDSPSIQEEETDLVLFTQPDDKDQEGTSEVAFDASEIAFDEDELSPLNPETIDDVYYQLTTETQNEDHHEVARYSLEQDPRLIQLVLNAARSVHELQNLNFDESVYNADLFEIKVIKVGLPLGVLFQENAGGCCVANVLQTGNAAKLAPDDAIRIGDQLAAVDGRNAIDVTVDDVCTLISEAENTQSIELTFVRYRGPLCTRGSDGYAETPDQDDDNEELVVSTSVPQRTLSEEHVFDTMHKMLPIAQTDEKNNTKKNETKKKNSQGKESKKIFQWFGRGRKM